MKAKSYWPSPKVGGSQIFVPILEILIQGFGGFREETFSDPALGDKI